MNNQSKKETKSKKELALSPVSEPVVESTTDKPKRGRPKTSPHDPATQHRVRMQRYRNAKREGEEVPVEIYLPKAWHDWLIGEKNVNLREVAVEAFALWMKKKGFPAEDTN